MKEKRIDADKPILGITCGDLNGIGPEVTMRALADHRILRHFTPLILSSSKVMSFYRKHLEMDDFSYFHTDNPEKLNWKKVNVLNVWDDAPEIVPGKKSEELGKYTRLSLEKGVELLKTKKIEALVTAPLNKSLVQSDEFNFPGHTEYLASAFDQEESLMFMVHDNIRVGVVTGHLPLSKVSDGITKESVLKKARMVLKSLSLDFGIKKPKLAVLGLNPHAGEDGLLGTEEADHIIPALEELKNDGHVVFGPFPADGFFGSGQYANFDGVLAMYHDQGLIPFKHIAFGGGVNFTAGLPFVRTSPDHGTAYALAGKKLADPASMVAALYTALDIVRERKAHTL